jgi:hypothetical protein
VAEQKRIDRGNKLAPPGERGRGAAISLLSETSNRSSVPTRSETATFTARMFVDLLRAMFSLSFGERGWRPERAAAPPGSNRPASGDRTEVNKLCDILGV